jgi:succinate dehydrogenase/fumarate reductase cytochrome b subunit
MANGIWRAVVVLHRYLGIAIGLFLVTWFLSAGRIADAIGAFSGAAWAASAIGDKLFCQG